MQQAYTYTYAKSLRKPQTAMTLNKLEENWDTWHEEKRYYWEIMTVAVSHDSYDKPFTYAQRSLEPYNHNILRRKMVLTQ